MIFSCNFKILLGLQLVVVGFVNNSFISRLGYCSGVIYSIFHPKGREDGFAKKVVRDSTGFSADSPN